MNSEITTSDDSVKVSNPTNYEWTSEEKQLFQNALAVLDPCSPDFYANIAYTIPWKSIDEVKEQYRQLIEESKQIYESHFHDQMPTLEVGQENHQEANQDEFYQINGASDPSLYMESVECTQHHRRKPVKWTSHEHQLFLIGLNLYGKGHWKKISQNCVYTRTPAQVASHAQKFFARQRSTTPSEKRRPSINDTVESFSFKNPNVVFSGQNISPNSRNDAFFSYPLQNSTPDQIGNQMALAPPNYTYYDHQGVENLYSNQNANITDDLDKFINSNSTFPPQNVIQNIGEEIISFSQPHLQNSNYGQDQVFNLGNSYESTFLASSSSSGSTNVYDLSCDANYHDN